MFIVDVAPLRKGATRDSLSYFASTNILAGSLVTIPLRNAQAFGVVLKSTPVADAKAAIKSSTFALKKINTATHGVLCTPAFMHACSKLADFFATDTGSVMSSLCPKAILEAGSEGALPNFATATEQPEEHIQEPKPHTATDTSDFIHMPHDIEARADVLALQAPDDDRLAHYRSLVRESFARGQSVFFCVPTFHDVARLEKHLSRGVEQFVFAFSGSLGKKRMAKRWVAAVTSKEPVVIIATGAFLSLPRHDYGNFVIENDLSGAFRQITRPSLDIRRAVETVAKEYGARTIIAGSLLRIATIERVREHDIAEYAPLQYRSLTTATCKLLQMKKIIGSSGADFIIHPDLLATIERATLANERVFLFNSRRGLAPLVVCGDCGSVVPCDACEAPVALHGGTDPREPGNRFMCHRCGKRRDAGERCRACDSWNLKMLGIGTETISEYLKKHIPHATIHTLSSDTAPTRTAAEKIISSWYSSGGSILIGTELALPYLTEPVEHTAVVSIDPLFSLPDFLVHERVMNSLLAVRARATHSVTFQTRRENTRLFDLAIAGNLIDYCKEELQDRRETSYPPFSLFITISVAGTKDAAAKEMGRIKGIIDDLSPDLELSVFPAFVPVLKGKFILNGLIQLPRSAWIIPDLLEVLRNLHRSAKIVIDAESVM